MAELFGIEGKVALVTGGSRGIGLMIARGFVEAGAKVYISSRKADALEQAAAELSGTGECVAIPADLSTEDGCNELAAAVAGREPAVHILVNNAGATWGAPIAEYPASAWDRVIDTNVKGPFFLTRALLPQLRTAATADDPARVIMIGSIDGIRISEFEHYAYPASKAAIHMLARDLAHKLVRDNITVNAVAPGLFPSKMTNFLFSSDHAGEVIAQTVPMGRPGRPEDMAGIAIFLSSRAGSYLTGAVIPVDGGVSTHG
ncbi:MAG TPA: SDR family oxidoreductase [Actinomycetota bacterium]|nr:SDR family oxidoreductase [Actinomycetota bacterium]